VKKKVAITEMQPTEESTTSKIKGTKHGAVFRRKISQGHHLSPHRSHFQGREKKIGPESVRKKLGDFHQAWWSPAPPQTHHDWRRDTHLNQTKKPKIIKKGSVETTENQVQFASIKKKKMGE